MPHGKNAFDPRRLQALRTLLARGSSVGAPPSSEPLTERVNRLERLVAVLFVQEPMREVSRKPLSTAQIEQPRRAARFRVRDLDGRFARGLGGESRLRQTQSVKLN
jgi:hypothetical protein